MNKRYMDFVPGRATGSRRAVKSGGGVSGVSRNSGDVRNVSRGVRNGGSGGVSSGARSRSGVSRSVTEKELVLGVVEDLTPSVQGSSRPVARGHFATEKDEAKALKAKRIGMKAKKGSGVGVEAKKTSAGVSSEFRAPRPAFINQDKVVKRPLSKNVYRKEVTANEEPKGPVAIIEKPERPAHISLIVTIILTIILGAAAGTVAFLLLPK